MSDEVLNSVSPTLQEPPEETSRQRHQRKVNAEALERKRNKKKPVKIEIETVHDSRGKAKYRKVFFMPNGMKHAVLMHKSEVERLKAQKKIP